MLIGVPKEIDSTQTLVAASPDTVKKLIKLGYEVCIEKGAGVKAQYSMINMSKQARALLTHRRHGVPI